MASQSICTLHKLPWELRDAIYESAQEEWVKQPLIWKENYVYYSTRKVILPNPEPITRNSSSPLELALISDKQLYREVLECRLRKSTLMLTYGAALSLEINDETLSPLASRSIKSVILRIPRYVHHWELYLTLHIQLLLASVSLLHFSTFFSIKANVWTKGKSPQTSQVRPHRSL